MRLREVTCPTWGLCIYTAVLFVPVLPWDWQKLKFRSPVGWEGWSSLGRLNLWPRQVYIKLTFWQTSFPKTKCCWYNRFMIIQNQGETCPPAGRITNSIWATKELLSSERTDKFPQQNWVSGLCWVLTVTLRIEKMIWHSIGPTEEGNPGPWGREVECRLTRTPLTMNVEGA